VVQVQKDVLERGIVMTLLNIYPIENHDQIRIKYRLFKVRGIAPQSEDYDKNAQLLNDKLSRKTKSPCAIVKEDGQLFIAQPLGYPALPDPIPLVGTTALIEPTEMERELDYGSLGEKECHLAIRFLQFQLDGLLHHNSLLWRPSAGMPYYQKQPDFAYGPADAVMYRGFRFRLILLAGNKIGVCIDVTRKYASPHYLPSKIQDNELRRYKGRKCIYEFGNRWYEITITGKSDYNVSEEKMPNGVSLFDHIHASTKGPKQPCLMTLPKDCSVLTYHTSLGEVRHVPSALCRLTFATNQPDAAKFHSRTIMAPHIRKQEIEFAVHNYLRPWKLQGIAIVLSQRMLELDCDVLATPSILFGSGKVLSLTDEGIDSISEFGSSRKQMLYSSDAGFFVKRALDRQYLIIPNSMYATYGPKFLEDMKKQFSRLYSPNGEIQYDPILITYDDSVRKSIYTLGKEILRSADQAIGTNLLRAGYGLVIIPRLGHHGTEREDELANLLMREFRKMDIFVSVSHTEIPASSYVSVGSAGNAEWVVDDDERTFRRFKGYLEGLILNKILLLNNLWPFVLSSPLNSDLTIGVDVKNNTAGFMFIFKEGRSFVFKTATSEQKEHLGRSQVLTVIHGYLRDELATNRRVVRSITIHRDGRLYPEEIQGARDAFDKLAKEGLVEKDCDCNFTEIKKTSRVPLRMFEHSTPQGSMKEWIENPRIGKYRIFDDTAFVCTTGRPFRYPGTTRPLQVTKIGGRMNFKHLLQDVFSLANLTWMKPEACSRLPISVKMTDIRLREVAGEYDEDKMKYLEEEGEE
jgi:hypothetical protein